MGAAVGFRARRLFSRTASGGHTDGRAETHLAPSPPPCRVRFHGSDRPGNTTTNYLAVVGDETVWPGSKPVTAADVTDGLGQTILLVENRGAGVHWMEPRDLALADIDLRVNAPAGVSSPYDDP